MKIATLRETANFTNKVNAVSPWTLGQVMEQYVKKEIAGATIDPSQIDLSAYEKKSDLSSDVNSIVYTAGYIKVESSTGKIDAQYLPSYVDDVLEYASKSAFPNPGEAGKIYVALDTNLTYRWTGSAYVEISQSLALGETSASAYRGDRGKTAYDHTLITGNPHNLTLSDLSISISAATINLLSGLSKNIVTALDEKLSLSGGTMTGILTLYADPINQMEAATRHYVDASVNNISVTVSQHVTQISNLENSVSGLNSSVGTITDTLVTVENDITGLNQTTETHTENINRLTSNVGGITSRVSAAETSITTLEATVDLLQVELDRYAIVIPVDEENKPLQTASHNTGFVLTYTGNDVTPDSTRVTGSHTGITCTVSGSNIVVSVNASTAIPNAQNDFLIEFFYSVGGYTYTAAKYIYVSTVPKGLNGDDGIVLQINSSNGLVFRHTGATTLLNVTVFYGTHEITNLSDLHTYVGSSTYLQWKLKQLSDSDYTIVQASDTRLSNDGFTFTLDTSDIDNCVTFICEVLN